MSMGRAFKMAGVKSHMASLWNIDDQQSSRIIIDFFQYLKKEKNKSFALQKAKINRINNSEDPKFAHPYFWAPMIINGNTQRINISKKWN